MSESLFTIDFVLHIFTIVFLNPALATLVPLSMYFSTSIPTTSPHFRLSLLYSTSLWTLSLLSLINRRLRQVPGRHWYSFAKTPRLAWSNQVIVVTGGSSGLGHALSSVLAMHRATIIVLDSTPPHDPIPGVDYRPCDVSDDESVKKATAYIAIRYGSITTVISNAGVMVPGTIFATTLDAIDLQVRVNLRAQFVLARNLVPVMRCGVSQWVTISSSLGFVGVHSLSAYAATKAATISFHESLTAETRTPLSGCEGDGGMGTAMGRDGRDGLVTTLVVPGQLDSPMFRNLRNPSSFFAPTVSIMNLARLVASKIEKREGGEFGVPGYVGLMGLMRVVPEGVREVVRWWSGMDAAAIDLTEAHGKLRVHD